MTKESAFQQKVTLLVSPAQSLKEAREYLLPFLRFAATLKPLGYVAGPINADGPTGVQANLDKLRYHTRLVQTIRPDLAVFCSADVFTRTNLPDILSKGVTEPDFYNFWDDVLRDGGIRDVFFAPRWSISIGAQREYSMATRLNLNIYDLNL